MLLAEQREAVVWHARRTAAGRLGGARHGNITVWGRVARPFAITPSALE